MGWSDKDWDDYIRGQPGTVFGEIGRRDREEINKPWRTDIVEPIAPPIEPAERTPFEETLAQWIFIGVWGSIAYFGIQHTELDWYWPVGVGGVVGFVLYKLFQGPLRVLLTGVKYVLIMALVGGVGALLYRLLQGSA